MFRKGAFPKSQLIMNMLHACNSTVISQKGQFSKLHFKFIYIKNITREVECETGSHLQNTHSEKGDVKSSKIWKGKGRSRTAATSKKEHFMVTVNG